MRKFAAICIVVLFVSACAGPRTAVRQGKEAPEDVSSRVIGGLKERNARLKSLKGFAAIRFGSGIFSGRGDTAFVVEGPGRARIDALTDFGVSQSQLALDGRTLNVYWPSDGSYFQGEATPETLGRYAGVGLSPSAMIGILLEKIPMEDQKGAWKVFEAGEGTFLVKNDGLEVLVSEKGEDLVLERYTVFTDGGRPVYRISLDGYSKDGRPAWFADRLSARFWKEGESKTKARIDVEYRDLEFNSKIDGKTFVLKIPDDAQRVSNP